MREEKAPTFIGTIGNSFKSYLKKTRFLSLTHLTLAAVWTPLCAGNASKGTEYGADINKAPTFSCLLRLDQLPATESRVLK